MESYSDYYYYELTKYDKIDMILLSPTSKIEYYLDYVFIHNTYTFGEAIDYIKTPIYATDESTTYPIIYPIIFFWQTRSNSFR
jgi:hypothetical protein